MCKRDIEGAPNRIFIHPDLSKLTVAELDGKMPGLDENVMVSHLVLPFGWIAIPSYFQLFGIAMQELHESYGMGDIGWSGIGHFPSFVYADDAIWVENAFASRLSGSVEAWEWARRRILNE